MILTREGGEGKQGQGKNERKGKDRKGKDESEGKDGEKMVSITPDIVKPVKVSHADITPPAEVEEGGGGLEAEGGGGSRLPDMLTNTPDAGKPSAGELVEIGGDSAVVTAGTERRVEAESGEPAGTDTQVTGG